ncbi:MAG: helix-turn-helix transcriptional regulator [Anaerolineae bacterium]|nr:helix-turn-helix transcriptional regulator [Anaerolineae bacterium]
MPGKKTLDYDPIPFQELLQRLLEESGESYRTAASAAGLHPTTLSKYMGGTRPMRDACIALADHFGINPNEMLQAAGYDPLHFFDRRLVDKDALPPEVELLVGEILAVEDETLREDMVEALRQVLHVQRQIHAKKEPAHAPRQRSRQESVP